MKTYATQPFSLLLTAAAALVLACGGDSGGSAAPGSTAVVSGEQAAANTPVPGLAGIWITDFSKASIPLGELTRAQVKDGIPALSAPLLQFAPVSEADFFPEQEPVISFQEGNDARAYPLQILIWHEIVNDVVGGRPVLITFCPLCNSAITFDRTVEGRVLEFGVSGFLRENDLIMFDRATESFWQQITGEALTGEFTGTTLEFLPSSIVSWADFRDSFPEGQILSRDTGYSRPYGSNPYVGYDDINSSPFLYESTTGERLHAMERVVAVAVEEEAAAYPFSRLEVTPVVNDSVGGSDIVVFFKPGTTSALDQESILYSRDIGSATVYSAIVDEQRLTFRADGEAFRDEETRSTWNILGRAVAGPLAGRSLEPVVSGNHFWFAWVAFQPGTRVWDGS